MNRFLIGSSMDIGPDPEVVRFCTDFRFVRTNVIVFFLILPSGPRETLLASTRKG